MTKRKVLIVDDDPISLAVIQTILSTASYDIQTAINGRDGLDKFKKNPTSLVVTDIEMPIMDGKEMIQHLKELDEDVLVLVISAHEQPEMIIETMRMGIYDYLIKPIDMNDVIAKLKRAEEIFDLRKIRRQQEKEKLLRLESQMEWYRYKDKFEMRTESSNRMDMHKALFENLKVNFTQGAGFGIIDSISQFISDSPKNESGDYIVSAELVDILQQNNKIIQRALKTIEEIDSIIMNDISHRKISIFEIYDILIEEKNYCSKYLHIKNQKIIINDPKSKYKEKFIIFNDNYFAVAIRELIINALKFSNDSSEIIILAEIDDAIFRVSILNTPMKDQKGRLGIPEEYYNLIFEPFFRLSAYVNEHFETLDYGLGLTLVDKIINKFNGKINISYIKNHLISKSNEQNKLEFTIVLPLLD